MRFKLFISLICFFIVFLIGTSKANSIKSSASSKALIAKESSGSVRIYTVRLLIGTIYYIFVYEDDGSLIAVYPDEDDTPNP